MPSRIGYRGPGLWPEGRSIPACSASGVRICSTAGPAYVSRDEPRRPPCRCSIPEQPAQDSRPRPGRWSLALCTAHLLISPKRFVQAAPVGFLVEASYNEGNSWGRETRPDPTEDRLSPRAFRFPRNGISIGTRCRYSSYSCPMNCRRSCSSKWTPIWGHLSYHGPHGHPPASTRHPFDLPPRHFVGTKV